MIPAHHTPATNRANTIIFLIAGLIVVLAVMASGCIKLVQQSTGSAGNPVPDVQSQNPVVTPVPADPAALVLPTGSPVPATMVQPVASHIVADAAPILPPDIYPVQHAVQINESPWSNRHVRSADFSRTYVLRGNATGLVVNATALEGPLWIGFDIEPLYDCLEQPESCRGEAARTISRPYFRLTVRDNETGEIVAEDGYGQEFSSQKTNRTIKIYEEGRYHLTLTGNSVDVSLAVATGTAPIVSATQATPANTYSPEYLRYLEEVGG
jgi:hypothetical protein